MKLNFRIKISNKVFKMILYEYKRNQYYIKKFKNSILIKNICGNFRNGLNVQTLQYEIFTI